MQVKLADPDFNYSRAEKLLEKAMENRPDIIVLPETWNTGFYISRKLKEIADEEGKRTRKFCSDFAKENHLYGTSGGDTHEQHEPNIGKAGMAFPYRIKTEKELANALFRHDGRCIINGVIQPPQDI